MVVVALTRIATGPATFTVQGSQLAPATTTGWTHWAAGRIYPPEGTYWVQATAGVNVEKRGSETVKITPPTLVRFTDGDHLLLQFMQDGQAIRLEPA